VEFDADDSLFEGKCNYCHDGRSICITIRSGEVGWAGVLVWGRVRYSASAESGVWTFAGTAIPWKLGTPGRCAGLAVSSEHLHNLLADPDSFSSSPGPCSAHQVNERL